MFSDINDYNSYESKDDMNIIVVTEECLGDIGKLDVDATIVVLTMSSSINCENSEINFVNRFNSSKEIVEKTLGMYYENNKLMVMKEQKGRASDLVAFYSPIGGSGQTVLSIAYAKLLAQEGKKVLYFSLDQYLDLEFLLTSADKFDLTYLLCSYGEGVNLKDEIDKIKVIDEDSGLHFIKSHEMYKDIVELDGKEDTYWRWFISSLAALEGYDYIVVDIPNDLNDKHTDILDIASKLYVVINNGTVEMSKVMRFKNQLHTFAFYKKHKDSSSLKYILNNPKNVASSNKFDDSDIRVSVEIPFDNKFKAYDAKNKKVVLNTNTAVGEKLSQLVE
jgi:cellulose biosynthesis protein BcsQ